MPKRRTHPELYDRVTTLSVASLKKGGLLVPNKITKGSITWSVSGEETSSISIIGYATGERWFINLQYTCQGKDINYAVRIVSKPSNLGIGKVLYFVCPSTGKQCRKLYLIDTLFLHREAYTGNAMYSSQARSKRRKLWDKMFDLLESPYLAPHMKKHYQGKVTKRYAKVLELRGKALSNTSLMEYIAEQL